MANNPLVLTFDIGTQSARALLVDKHGKVVCKVQKSFEKPYHSPHPGWAEQDPNMYWNVMGELSQQLKSENTSLWNDIIAVTCACIRATTICLDKNGRPLRDAIVWLDKRKSKMSPIPPKSKLAFNLVRATPIVEILRNNMASNWIIQNQPEIWAKTDKFVLLSAYFNMLFCGNLIDSTANTVGVLPFDTKTRSWLKKSDVRYCLYNVSADKLIDLVEPGEIIGKITSEAAKKTGIKEGLPYIVTGADKACETLGLGITSADQSSVALSFGTTATIEAASDKYFSAHSIVPPYVAITGGFLPEVETFRGYWLISWFKKEFAIKEVEESLVLGCSAEELLDKRLKEIPAGCDGLVLQPTFTPDATTPHAKGAIIGFSDVHTRIHLYRAIIEGINFSLMEGLRCIEKKGNVKINRLFVAGGGSRSNEICQITANMFGIPVYRTQTHEVCGVGSSIVAFVKLGIYPNYSEAIKNMVQIKDEFLPDLEEHKIYHSIYTEIYCKMFKNLAPLYEKLHSILTQGHIQ